jgi:predicted lipoprotein with Yx(FWY)xxD motif
VIRIPRTVVPSAVCLTALALLTACSTGTPAAGGAGAAGYPAQGGGGPATLAMPAPISPGSTDPMKSQLRAARPFDLGPMLVDGTGYTLYRYDRDTTNPPKSNCIDACAQKWIPVTVQGPMSVIGVDQALVGTVARDDGTDQYTLKGWPLYHYMGDGMPGETAGQGVDQAWFPITPTGEKLVETQDSWRANAFRL